MTEPQQNAKAEKAEVPTYHVDRLLAESGAFFDGEFAPHEVAAGLSSGNKKNFTLEEASKSIKAFLKGEDSTVTIDSERAE